MSDENTPSADDFKALQEKFDQLDATNKRILGEHKADKVKFKRKQEEWDAAEAARAAEGNDFEKMFNIEQEKNKNLSSEVTDLRSEKFSNNLEREVRKLAEDAHNPAQVMRALRITEKNTDWENGTLTDLPKQLEDLRKSEVNLFKGEVTKTTTTVPGYVKNPGQPGEKKINDMTVSEAEQALRDKIAARTQ